MAKYTNNTVQIKVYPNAQLGTPDAQLQGLESGTLQFYASPDVSSAEPAVDTIELPFLFTSIDAGSKVLNGPAVRRDLWSKFASHNIRVLGVWSIGFSDIYTVSGHPVNAADDMHGLRIRIFNPGVAVPFLKGLGADGVTLPSTQVPTAMSTHTIDGADDPPSTMYESKWTTGGGTLAMTNDMLVPSPVMVNTAFWSKLSSSQQAAVTKAFHQTLASNIQLAKQSSAASVKGLQTTGIKLTHPNIAEFRAKAQGVYSELQGKYGKIVPDLQAAAKTANAASPG